MLQKLLGMLAILVCTNSAIAQKTLLQGNIKDTATNKSVQYAVVALLTPKDSVIKAFTRVQQNGDFSLQAPAGKYILSISHPNFGDYVDDIEITSETKKLGFIALTPKSKLLEAVIVKTGSAFRLKGDTTIFTADSFKVSANANVEELLKKMPGIQVDKNGQIKALGQTVEKVLVDGEEFFGDDPGMAVKNLRADAVKEVQIFDKKSDQAEFTGIDDGKTQKTINLKLKEDKKKGYFGKIDVAGGLQKDIDDRYNDNVLLSSFKGKRKITGFFLNGNTGQDGLSWRDEEKFGGGSDNVTFDEENGYTYFSRGGGGGDDEPYVDTQNGFITNTNAGLQYSNKYNDKTTINFSPKFNNQRYFNKQATFTQTPIGDSVLIQNQTQNTNVDRTNLKIRAIYDTKLDSNNTLKITANTNFYNTNSAEFSNSVTTGKTGTLKNTANKKYTTNSDKQAFSGNAIFKHKFKKARRTLSLNVDMNVVNTDANNFLKSTNQDFFSGTTQNIDQLRDNEKTTTTTAAKLVYTEPLSKKYSLELGYQLAVNNGNNTQFTYDYTAASGKYDARVDSLSNQFKQNITQQTPSVKVSYSHKKIKLNAGSGISFSNFELNDITFNKTYNRNYINYFPSAGLNYTYKSNHNIGINYNGSTRQPTLNQLQPLRNNVDQFNQYIGNPNLRNAFTNNLRVNHNGYNFLKDIYFYQGLNFTIQQNAITNSRFIDANTGKTTTQPINTNGNYSGYLYGGGGGKIKKLNIRTNVNFNVGYNKYVEFINNVKSNSTNTDYGLSLYLSKEKDKKYDVSISSDINYNSQTTSQNAIKNNYFSNNYSASATVYYKKVWSITSDVNYFTRQKTAQLKGINNTLWNASLQRTFKKDEFTVYLKVRDILNQNIGVSRNFYNQTFTETRNDRLKRYFLVGFTWNFKNKAAKAK